MVFLDGSRHLDGRERAKVAVVVAALRHGVDVRAENDGLSRRVGARAAANDVTGGVDLGAESRLAHEGHRPLAGV